MYEFSEKGNIKKAVSPFVDTKVARKICWYDTVFFQFLRWGLNQRSMSRTLQLATIRSAFCQLQPSAARSLSPNFNLQEKILFMSKSQFIQAHRMKKVITPFPLKKTDFYKKSKFLSQKKGGYPIEKKQCLPFVFFSFEIFSDYPNKKN